MLGAGFSGPWFDLRTSYRMPRQLTQLARTYLGRFHPEPDALLPEPSVQQELDTDICRLKWLQTSPQALADDTVESIRAMVVDSRVDEADVELAFADVVFLCDRLQLGREIVERLGERNVRVANTFASAEQERRRQKRYFFKGSEKVKATTFHSFKGWEGRALVVAVGSARGDRERRALYAGLTRLKAHPHGSYLTVVCAEPALRQFGQLWPEFIASDL